MLKDLPVHTRQSLYRCLDVTSECWIELEPELTWAKYTSFSIETSDTASDSVVNGFSHGLFGCPAWSDYDGSVYWRNRDGSMTKYVELKDSKIILRLDRKMKFCIEIGPLLAHIESTDNTDPWNCRTVPRAKWRSALESMGGGRACAWVSNIIDINHI